jgi:hypothetical protein
VTDSVQDTSSATTTAAPTGQLGEETAHSHVVMLESQKYFSTKKGKDVNNYFAYITRLKF